MWREISAPDRSGATTPAAAAKPIDEEELGRLLDRLETSQNVLRENQELRSLLSHREAETRDLRTRNADMEELLRKFAPLLVNAGTAMGLVAKREKPETRIFT